MAVQQEIKSQLAKLLATEDLIVEHKRVESAQFNVHTRVLILPLWENATNDVYDMLVGHEVGHALFTPDIDWSLDLKVPQQIMNVVEDARIEKLMKRKYMGLAKSFYKGYSELYNKDFFEIDGEDINTFNLADRINLYYKIGSWIDVPFSIPEKKIVDIVGKCETFEDVKKASLILYEYCKQQQEKEKGEKKIKEDSEIDQSFNSSLSLDEMFDEEVSEELEKDVREESNEENNQSQTSTLSAGDSSEDGVVDVRTADSLEDKLKDLVNTQGLDNVYVEIPKVNLDNIIASNVEIHEEFDRYWKYETNLWKQKSDECHCHFNVGFDEADAEFHTFKREAQKEVSYLVKEFECKKSASAYARTSTSRTGVINTLKLHEYKFSEDLFKKINVLPKGKNHGLIFILDWSGSMQHVLQDTLKQLYNLLWFCKKVQIPFEVYAFTNEWGRRSIDYDTGVISALDLKSSYKEEEGKFCIDEHFNLLNLFTSKVNLKTLETHMLNAWRVSMAFNRTRRIDILYSWPNRLALSGTPLNETLVSLHQLIPQFQKNKNVEKVQCIVLTDGEANYLPHHRLIMRSWESTPYLGQGNHHPQRTFLRDRKLGKIYKFEWGYHQFTDTLLNNLKDNFPHTNFIGIRVVENRDAKQFIRRHHGEDEKLMIDWKKNKSFIITKTGYDAYFGLSSSVLSQDAEFDVDEDATKAEIKRAFVKSLRTKKLNKKVLGEFIELVV